LSDSSEATLAFTPMAAQKVEAKVIPISSAAKSFQLRNTCFMGVMGG